MKDEEFVKEVEDCSIQSFHHEDHVRLAWLFLRDYPVLDALARFSETLKRFAASRGNAAMYHETITCAYVFLIHERMTIGMPATWEQFVDKNADLTDWNESILASYYRKETLQSGLARRVFILPDKAIHPGASNS